MSTAPCGTYTAYRRHRAADEDACGPCTDAAARYERGRQLDILNGRPRLVPSIGTQRRLQALAALGHTWQTIATEIGMERTNLRRLATQPRRTTSARLAGRIAEVYDAWSMRVPAADHGQAGRRYREALATAERHGWAPPLAWEGINIDDPAARPDRGRRTARARDDVDEALVRRVLSGDTSVARNATPAERRLIVAAWPNATRSLADLAHATGWRPDRYTQPTMKENTAA